jgi:hypothetical protein
MHHKQAARCRGLRWCKNVTSCALKWCVFGKRGILPLRFRRYSVFSLKGPLCGLFHFWHSPCFILRVSCGHYRILTGGDL